MSILVFAELQDGKFTKPALEAATYGAHASKANGEVVNAITFGSPSQDQLTRLASTGISGKIYTCSDQSLTVFDSKAYANVLSQLVNKESASLIVLSATFTGKSLAPRLAARLGAGLITHANSLVDGNTAPHVSKSVYSSKGKATFTLSGKVNVVSVAINSFHVDNNEGASAQTEEFTPDLSGTSSNIKVEKVEKQKGKINLGEAEIVVSAGRGLKGPENWHLVEALAEELGAATACSKPVSDADWRPHAEHVGQTGLTVAPNLYIAIGISGAIQHLAGVSNSKIIAVINKDPEAPFFKAADYGIVGDAFEILPKLLEAAKKIHSHN